MRQIGQVISSQINPGSTIEMKCVGSSGCGFAVDDEASDDDATSSSTCIEFNCVSSIILADRYQTHRLKQREI
jgi:hypothetical protein